MVKGPATEYAEYLRDLEARTRNDADTLQRVCERYRRMNPGLRHHAAERAARSLKVAAGRIAVARADVESVLNRK